MSKEEKILTKEEQAEMVLPEEEESTGADYTHVFEKPFTWNGKTYEKLDFNFEKLTGKDSLAIYNELQAKNILVLSPRFSHQYQVCLASRACGLGTDAFDAMPYRDFERIIGKTKGFIPTADLL